ncbi:hypothetical protein LTS14_009977 [Recurvomyces mirabilis]|uniref:uncharacterized protein n=1 Tax=Recurvomyces mirabilis TaxID=574656 RepID=UPI002DE1259B|nr:hypothetical protein LTS14_009977 [Recurvomyces mirabilis]
MAEGSSGRGDGLLDMEKELTCSEWFAWQAESVHNSRQHRAHPYTCPSCRDGVRGTKADWRLTTLLEGYLKANPDRAKSEVEKQESQKVYQPGDDVMPKVQPRRDDTDSEEERMISQARDLSMAEVDPETARRRAHRAPRSGREHRRQGERGDGSGRSQQTGQRQLSEAQLRQHDAGGPQIEHQPSLRSLLSASPIESLDVQQEILQSIYAEGLLDGLDLDNLTPAQEDQLTERIAEAYRRRQRRRDRSDTRDHGQQGEQVTQPSTAGAEAQMRDRHHARTVSASAQQSRPRPPISRPHLFEQDRQYLDVRHQRSTSTASQQSNRSAHGRDGSTASAARSATDLTDQTRTDEGRRERHRALSNNARSITDPEGHRSSVHRMRASSTTERETRDDTALAARPLEAVRRQDIPTNNSSPSLIVVAPPETSPGERQIIRPADSNAAFAPEAVPTSTRITTDHQTIRPAPSTSAFAPEPIGNLDLTTSSAPSIKCARCPTINIQHDLHYHCPKCRSGSFYICLPCYRNEQGCDHWFGFGFKTEQRWYARAPPGGWSYRDEPPHVLQPRRYTKPTANTTTSTPYNGRKSLEDGAFCESCLSPANDCYWYCLDCLEGAWGYCDHCVQRGLHCTHPLLPVAHISTLRQPFADPTRATFVPMPHLRPDSYVLWPVSTDCDICHRKISARDHRFHCFRCSDGDYDVCTECYYNLTATGKISTENGANGWRKCLQGHRMAVVGFQDVPHGGQQRIIVRPPVGGWRYKDATASPGADQPFPPVSINRTDKALAAYNYFPRNHGADDLSFPKNAEITELQEETAEWYSGIYCARLGLFPSSHVRKT